MKTMRSSNYRYPININLRKTLDSKVSVVIPALNEEKTIARVIETAKAGSNVSEVIVIDDNSKDNTVAIARAMGARVVTGTVLGKGSSMADGLKSSHGDILVYLDADVESYDTDIVSLLVQPILEGKADFVKSTFNRKAGRVTELVAKPMLSMLFPEALRFSQPLSGMIAGTREVFEKVTFENDYGVDIGILLDVLNAGARISEVDIGTIEHKMKSWDQLPKMSSDVVRAILKRVDIPGDRIRNPFEKISIADEQMVPKIKNIRNEGRKLAIFSMDNTLIRGSFIKRAAQTFGFRQKLFEIASENQEPFIATKLTAKNFKGLSVIQLKSVIEQMRLLNDVEDTITELKSRGYIVGIISDSYSIVADYIRDMVGADFAVANELEIINGVATGEVRIPSSFLRGYNPVCNHSICKSHAVSNVASEYGVELANCIVVGNSERDICMVKNAGQGIAFCSNNRVLNSISHHCISTRSLRNLIIFLDQKDRIQVGQLVKVVDLYNNSSSNTICS